MTALQVTLLGYALRLARPEALFGLAAALLVALLGFGLALGRRSALGALFDPATRPRAVPGAAPGRHGARFACTGLALALFSLGLAQPQCGTHTELARRYGIDVVVALDASRSMLARDIKPSRLERAKLELSALLDRLRGDRVGIVVFAGDAFTQCPLTTDYAAAKMFLRAIDATSMPVQGTDLARALDESLQLLTNAERGAKARAVVLLTDGEQTAGAGALEMAAELAQKDVRVIAVGIGSLAGEPIPEVGKAGDLVGWKKDKDGQTVMTRLDEAGLKAIAQKTGGRYVHSLAGGVGVQEVWEELDRLDKTELESRLTVKYDDRFQWAVLPGFVALLVGAAIPTRRREGAR